MNRRKCYALYKGDTLLAIGNVFEIAEKMNISVNTVHFYGMPVYKKRVKNSDKRRELIVIDEKE